MTKLKLNMSHINQISKKFEWKVKDVKDAVKEFFDSESPLTTEQKNEFLIMCINTPNPQARESVLPTLYARFIEDDFLNKFFKLLLFDSSISVICKFNTYDFYNYPDIRRRVNKIIKTIKKQTDPMPHLKTSNLEDGLYSLYKYFEPIYDKKGKESGMRTNELENQINHVLSYYYSCSAIDPNSISLLFADKVLNEKYQADIRKSNNPDDYTAIYHDLLFRIIENCGPLALKINTIFKLFLIRQTFRERALQIIQGKERDIKFKRLSWLIYFVTQYILDNKIENKIERALKLAIDGHFKKEYQKGINYLRPRYYESRKKLRDPNLKPNDIKLDYQITDKLINKALEDIKAFKSMGKGT